MKLINPISITSSNVTTDVVELNTLWSVSTTYAIDTYAFVGDLVYKSLQNANTGNDPTSETVGSEVWWIEYSATNPLKAFDGIINSKTITDANTIYFTITASSIVDGIAILGLENVASIDISIPVSSYTTTENLETSTTGKYRTSAVFIDVPPYASSVITITFTRADSTKDIEVGEIILGKTILLGYTTYGASTGIIDYSSKTQDDFGNFIILERSSSKKSSITVKIEPAKVDYVLKSLINFRTTPSVWIINDKVERSDIFIIYGFYKDFTINLPDCTLASMSISIEGLV